MKEEGGKEGVLQKTSGRHRKKREIQGEEEGNNRRGGTGDKERQEKEGTSILRPSTIVPFSFSRARSASALVSNVTNPKPCSGPEVGLKTKQQRKEVQNWNDKTNGEKGERKKTQSRELQVRRRSRS